MKIFNDINNNLEKVKNKFKYDLTSDFIIRELKVYYLNKEYNAFICFYDGMINKDHINHNILAPLTTTQCSILSEPNISLEKYIIENVLTAQNIKTSSDFNELTYFLNIGYTAIFIDTLDVFLAVDTTSYEHRSVEKPVYESTIKGPQETFNEVMNTNRALIRKCIQKENLIFEHIKIGRNATNQAYLIYIEGITNMDIVKELKRRIESIDVDIVLTSETLEQYIENNTTSPIPQFLTTERPDRVASFLMDGRAVIMTNNSPNAIIAPTTIIDWFHSAEDGYLKFPFNYILKIVRLISIVIALLLPGLYIATVTYHIDSFPTNLALTLSGSREEVPFQFIIEMLIMELAFELLREAEMRVPSRIGPIISIVGGLVLGQLAVMANIICPFTMIIVGFTGIALYAIPNFYTAYGLRLIRYVFILAAFINGFLGLALASFLFLVLIANTRSFNTELLPSFYISKDENVIREIFSTPIFKREKRNYTNKSKNKNRQAKISRGWVLNDKQRH